MKLVKRKTRKAIRKSLSKVIDQHGAQIAAALAGGIASSLATLAKTESPDKPGTSNLAAMAEKAGAAVTGDEDESGDAATGHKKKKDGTRRRDPRLEAEDAEPAG